MTNAKCSETSKSVKQVQCYIVHDYNWRSLHTILQNGQVCIRQSSGLGSKLFIR